MTAKNCMSWSAMIAFYAKNEMSMKALEMFQLMVLEARDLLPNSVTMVSMLQACAGLAALEHGKMIHGYILRRGLHSILPVLSTLISYNNVWKMCHSGLVKEGKVLFEYMHSKYRIQPGTVSSLPASSTNRLRLQDRSRTTNHCDHYPFCHCHHHQLPLFEPCGLRTVTRAQHSAANFGLFLDSSSHFSLTVSFDWIFSIGTIVRRERMVGCSRFVSEIVKR
ncbi:hypothetical protein RJT34_16242 [Clitoria ternatea]|uniref:Pentatricopeptide repeat-containing protein n=1 Tax=Clitoria ternatea TaxID=43366 RepID=A0AAN9J738_CLITE